MSLKKEIFYKEYTNRENEILRAPYNPELEFYSVIKSGNIKRPGNFVKNHFTQRKVWAYSPITHYRI